MSSVEISETQPTHHRVGVARGQPTTSRLNALELAVAVLIATHPNRRLVHETMKRVADSVGQHPDAASVYGDELQALFDRLSKISGGEGVSGGEGDRGDEGERG